MVGSTEVLDETRVSVELFDVACGELVDGKHDLDKVFFHLSERDLGLLVAEGVDENEAVDLMQTVVVVVVDRVGVWRVLRVTLVVAEAAAERTRHLLVALDVELLQIEAEEADLVLLDEQVLLDVDDGVGIGRARRLQVIIVEEVDLVIVEISQDGEPSLGGESNVMSLVLGERVLLT